VWTAPAFEPAALDEIEELLAHAERTLVAMRFLNPRQPRRLLPRLRRLFARTRLEKAEVDILRGILARIDQLLERRA
jgi:tRNA/rRNA methyltransferase